MKENIANAIAAHKAWVADIKEALAKREALPAMKQAGYDDLCEFGKWLYSLDDPVKSTPAFRLVKDLHYRFHQEAALVVATANLGELDEAQRLSNRQFIQTSRDLSEAMETWQAQL